jgi:hypothetical protein
VIGNAVHVTEMIESSLPVVRQAQAYEKRMVKRDANIAAPRWSSTSVRNEAADLLGRREDHVRPIAHHFRLTSGEAFRGSGCLTCGQRQ